MITVQFYVIWFYKCSILYYLIDHSKMYNHSRSYENISPYSSYQPKAQHQSQSQTSLALFHIPSDAKNSIYVDGVPNDATEREVNRKIMLMRRRVPAVSRVPADQVDPEIYFHREGVPVVFCWFWKQFAVYDLHEYPPRLSFWQAWQDRT